MSSRVVVSGSGTPLKLRSRCYDGLPFRFRFHSLSRRHSRTKSSYKAPANKCRCQNQCARGFRNCRRVLSQRKQQRSGTDDIESRIPSCFSISSTCPGKTGCEKLAILNVVPVNDTVYAIDVPVGGRGFTVSDIPHLQPVATRQISRFDNRVRNCGIVRGWTGSEI